MNSIEKTLAVIDALASHDRVITIARHVGLSDPTVHRILGELVKLGWAIYVPLGRRYTLGPKVFDLASMRGVTYDDQRALQLLCRAFFSDSRKLDSDDRTPDWMREIIDIEREVADRRRKLDQTNDALTGHVTTEKT